ncbi:MAG: DnaA N-terminal domain-containing protein, partial [bacterium]
MTDNKKLWDSALAEIELTVSKANFGTWFRNTFISKQEQGTVYISVPNNFVRDWLASKFHKSIIKALR